MLSRTKFKKVTNCSENKFLFRRVLIIRRKFTSAELQKQCLYSADLRFNN